MVNDKKQNFLGEGSYGCVMKPGYDCKGNTNNVKNSVTKLTEINFASKNELFISNIIKTFLYKNKKIYKKHFAPIFKYCNLEFNKLRDLEIDKCENLLEDINDSFYNNFIKTKFYIFYVRYIYGAQTIIKYLKTYMNSDALCKNYIYSFHYLLNSIAILQKYDIVHNDLYNRNIMFDKKINSPIIIDFGLSYYIPKFYSNNKQTLLDFKIINKFLFDFRSDSYYHSIDKRFITFFLYNNNDYFNNKVTKMNQKNNLTQQLLDIFVDDAYYSIIGFNSSINIFEDYELQFYKISLNSFYGKFLNKTKYLTYSSIVIELLHFVFEFTDLYSISIEYIKFYSKLFKSDNKNFIIESLFLQLFKKVIFPDPLYRLNIQQIKNIIEFLINQLNDFNLDKLDNFDKNCIMFIDKFHDLLDKNDIKKENFFIKEYAFIDFEKILTPKNIKSFQDHNIKYKKFEYI